jgi:adenylate kinase family enzyme
MSPNLGKRIAIIGPSNSGKSTLASTLGERLHTPVLHLDLIAHQHGSNWVRVSDEELIHRQKEFIAQDSWVVEGNYSVCMPERFARADTIIWLDPPLLGCMWRYLFRCLRGNNRPGGLPGTQKEFSWKLISYTFNNYPKNKIKYEHLIAASPMCSLLELRIFGRLERYWRHR